MNCAAGRCVDSDTRPHGLSTTHLFVSYPVTNTVRIVRPDNRIAASHREAEPAVPLVPVTKSSPGRTPPTPAHSLPSDGACTINIPSFRAAASSGTMR